MKMFGLKLLNKMDIDTIIRDLKGGKSQLKISRNIDINVVDAVIRLIQKTFPTDPTHVFDDVDNPFAYRRNKYMYITKFRWGLWRINNRMDRRKKCITVEDIIGKL